MRWNSPPFARLYRMGGGLREGGAGGECPAGPQKRWWPTHSDPSLSAVNAVYLLPSKGRGVRMQWEAR